MNFLSPINASYGAHSAVLSSTDLQFDGVSIRTAGGDLSGTYPLPTVSGLSGKTLPSLSTGNLRYNGSSFVYDGTIFNTLTGFTPAGNAVITYNGTTAKTVTLTGAFTAYFNGVLISALTTGWVSPAHGASPTVPQYLAYDGATFSWFTTYPMFGTYMVIAIVVFDSSGNYIYTQNEAHGMMQAQSHFEDHYNIGTWKFSGGVISGITLNSTTTANRRPATSASIIYDEDLPTTNAIYATGSYSTMYLSGASGSAVFSDAQSDVVPLSGSQPQYNQWTGSTWQLTVVPNNNYCVVWQLAIPTAYDSTGSVSQNRRYVWIPGQSAGTLNAMQTMTPSSMTLNSVASLFVEAVFINKMILRYTAGDWVVIEVDAIAGNRASQFISGSGIQPSMQNSYNGGNLLTTSTALGALQIQRGSAADTDSVLQILNGAGSPTLGITGAGVISSATWNASVITYGYGGTGLTAPGASAGNLRWNGSTAYTIDTTTYLSTITADATSRTANTVYSAPNGSAGTATFRTLVSADLGNVITSPSATALTLGSNATSALISLSTAGAITLSPTTTGSFISPSAQTNVWGSNATTLITGSAAGVLTFSTVPTLPSQTANYIFAAPSGSAGAPTFRLMTAADIPAGVLGYTSLATTTVNGFMGHSGTTASSPVMISGSTANQVPVVTGAGASIAFGYVTAAVCNNTLTAASATALTMGSNAATQMTFSAAGAVSIAATTTASVLAGAANALTLGVTTTAPTAIQVTAAGAVSSTSIAAQTNTIGSNGATQITLTATGAVTIAPTTTGSFISPSAQTNSWGSNAQTLLSGDSTGTVLINSPTSGVQIGQAGNYQLKIPSTGNITFIAGTGNSMGMGSNGSGTLLQFSAAGAISLSATTSVDIQSASSSNTTIGAGGVSSILTMTNTSVTLSKPLYDSNTGVTYSNYISVNALATTNLTLSGTQTVDGVALGVGQLCAALGQTTASARGVYVVSATAWTRALGFATSAQIQRTDIYSSAGTTYGGTWWMCTTAGAITVDSTGLTFVQLGVSGGLVSVTSDATSRTANTVYAAPNGSNGTATFRTLVAADIGNAITAIASTALTLGSGGTAGLLTFNTAGTAATFSVPIINTSKYLALGTTAVRDLYSGLDSVIDLGLQNGITSTNGDLALLSGAYLGSDGNWRTGSSNYGCVMQAISAATSATSGFDFAVTTTNGTGTAAAFSHPLVLYGNSATFSVPIINTNKYLSLGTSRQSDSVSAANSVIELGTQSSIFSTPTENILASGSYNDGTTKYIGTNYSSQIEIVGTTTSAGSGFYFSVGTNTPTAGTAVTLSTVFSLNSTAATFSVPVINTSKYLSLGTSRQSDTFATNDAVVELGANSAISAATPNSSFSAIEIQCGLYRTDGWRTIDSTHYGALYEINSHTTQNLASHAFYATTTTGAGSPATLVNLLNLTSAAATFSVPVTSGAAKLGTAAWNTSGYARFGGTNFDSSTFANGIGFVQGNTNGELWISAPSAQAITIYNGSTNSLTLTSAAATFGVPIWSASQLKLGGSSATQLTMDSTAASFSVPIYSTSFVQSRGSCGTAATLPPPVSGGVFCFFATASATITSNSGSQIRYVGNTATATATLAAFASKTFCSDGTYWFYA